MIRDLEFQRNWFKALRAHFGLSYSKMAKNAGIAHTVITERMKEDYSGGTVSDTSIQAIAQSLKVQPYELPNNDNWQVGFSEEEAAKYVFEETVDNADNFDRAVRTLCSGRNGRDPWLLNSDKLNLSGVLPGDVLIVDLNTQPKPNDIVCAQLVASWQSGKAETVFRIYQPPYLISHSSAGLPDKPQLIDNDNVIVRGTVISTMRNMRGPQKNH